MAKEIEKEENKNAVEENKPTKETKKIEEEKTENTVKYEPPEFLKKLLDPENKDPIEFIDENGENLSFEQVAIIPRDGKVYAILKPVDEMEGVKEDEALVFVVDYDEDLMQDYLKLVEDDADIEIVFQMYYDLLRDAGVDVDGE